MLLEKCLCWGVPQDKSVPAESISLSQHPSRSNRSFPKRAREQQGSLLKQPGNSSWVQQQALQTGLEFVLHDQGSRYLGTL